MKPKYLQMISDSEYELSIYTPVVNTHKPGAALLRGKPAHDLDYKTRSFPLSHESPMIDIQPNETKTSISISIFGLYFVTREDFLRLMC